MANAAGGAFSVHRRFVLEVALEVGDRGGGDEDFTAAAAGGAGGADGGGVGEATAMGEAAGGGGGVGRATTAGGGAVGGGGVAIAKPGYLAKALSTALVIMTSNSWSCCSENPEAMVLRLLLARGRASLKVLRRLWRCEV